MPVYEFYCKSCHTIYQFFSKSVNTEKIPHCPKCDNQELERTVSAFAMISHKEDSENDEMMPDIDESKIERAMAMLAGEAEKLNEDDPRQAVNFMRKLSKEAGIKLGPKMEEALGRMESGEDPESIEADMGEDLNEDELFVLDSRKKSLSKRIRTKRDNTIYDL